MSGPVTAGRVAAEPAAGIATRPGRRHVQAARSASASAAGRSTWVERSDVVAGMWMSQVRT
jgi:hypothetical protein